MQIVRIEDWRMPDSNGHCSVGLARDTTGAVTEASSIGMVLAGLLGLAPDGTPGRLVFISDKETAGRGPIAALVALAKQASRALWKESRASEHDLHLCEEMDNAIARVEILHPPEHWEVVRTAPATASWNMARHAQAYHYVFTDAVALPEAEDLLLRAVWAVESLYGRSAVRLDAAFVVDRQERTCVIGADKEVGRAIARIFTGFLTRQFAEEAFRIQREERSACPDCEGTGSVNL